MRCEGIRNSNSKSPSTIYVRLRDVSLIQPVLLWRISLKTAVYPLSKVRELKSKLCV